MHRTFSAKGAIGREVNSKSQFGKILVGGKAIQAVKIVRCAHKVRSCPASCAMVEEVIGKKC